jgi:outer membrane protein assembly factor BamB
MLSSPAVVENATLGERLAYVGNNKGAMTAYNEATGAVVWTYTTPKYKGLSQQIASSPAVFDGVVYFGSNDWRLWAVNATTGAFICSFTTIGQVQSSPTVVEDPDGSGPVVYIGDYGPSANPAPNTGAEWEVYGVGNNHGQCTEGWEFHDFDNQPDADVAGTWSSAAYGPNANGQNVVVFGSTDNDDAVYSVNAATGAFLWRFQTHVSKDTDVGASPVLSAPGVNGFAGGVAYVAGKDKTVYAINLTTGAQIWDFDIAKDDHVPQMEECSSAALVGDTIYLGSGVGLYALNATTGAKVWHVLSGDPIFSSPAVTGASGSQVAIVTDIVGGVYAVNLKTGATLWSNTSSKGYWASPAVSDGIIVAAGLDGVVRTFDLSGTG